MKKRVFAFTFCLFPLLGFSYELNFSKSFSKIINPDILSINVSINIEKKDESKVNIEVEKFNNFIKRNKEMIKNGSFTLSPKYKYYDKKQEFVGYVGNLRYSAESRDAKEINSFINELIALKESIKSEDVNINISNVSWKSSEQLQSKSYDDLRLETINWIENYTNSLSAQVSKRCEVSKINIPEIANGNLPFMMAQANLVMAKRDMDVVPVNSEQNITIISNFVLDCK